MANAVYNYFKQGVLLGSFNLSSFPLYCALVSNSYSPDVDNDKYHADLSHVVTPSNYQAYFALSDPSVTQDDTNNQGVLDGSDISIEGIQLDTTVRACVIFGSSGSGFSSDPLVGYFDFSSDQELASAGTLQIQWASGGILALT